jgi:hypothetical protein
MNTLLGSLTLVEITCCNCFTHFAMDKDLNQRLRSTGGTFYCPNGHGQVYTESEVQRLQKQLNSTKKQLTWAEEIATRARLEAKTVKREKAAIKGQLTKTRNRIANGVCPCCHRTFKQLAAHMNNKHPDFKEAVS